MPVSKTTPGRWALALSRPSVLPSVTGTTSAPRMRVLSRLNGWPMRSPSTLRQIPSRVSAHTELGVDAVRYSFIVMDLHHLILAESPAHSGLPPCVDGSGLARAFFTFAALVGAPMCSAF